MATNKRLSSEERNIESSNDVKRKDYSTYFNPIVSLNMLSNERMNNVSTLQSIDILDSGASIHATPYAFRLFNVKTTNPIPVSLADTSIVTLSKIGSLHINIIRKLKRSCDFPLACPSNSSNSSVNYPSNNILVA